MAHGEPFPCACCGTYHMHSYNPTPVNEATLEARVEALEREIAQMKQDSAGLAYRVGQDIVEAFEAAQAHVYGPREEIQ